jgi:hypothetical protein
MTLEQGLQCRWGPQCWRRHLLLASQIDILVLRPLSGGKRNRLHLVGLTTGATNQPRTGVRRPQLASSDSASSRATLYTSGFCCSCCGPRLRARGSTGVTSICTFRIERRLSTLLPVVQHS